MTPELKSITTDAVKIAVAAWGAFYIEPTIGQILPTVPTPLRYLISVLIPALVIAAFCQLCVGKAEIEIIWEDKKESAPLSEVRARVRKSNNNTQIFRLHVYDSTNGWIARRIMNRLFSDNQASLQIRIIGALVVPTCESSSKINGIPAVSAEDESNGFTIRLGVTPARQGIWQYAEVRWRDEGTPRSPEFNIDYVFLHENQITERLLNRFIGRESNASAFRIVGS